ncbi:unnamed protein product [Ceratitis capitata]|uniref:(Mediterranean fruit fly) hypothetical protein n=1 Tax=Ceratitis capitata TaxID=7213 RepID=A0A811UMX4_CERCA|nr:unnamed protein product [Ceratitis capitata]
MPTTHHYCVSGVVALNKAIQFNTVIVEINSHVSLFRDMLYRLANPGLPRVTRNIRKLRRICVDTCKHMGQAIIPKSEAVSARASEVLSTYSSDPNGYVQLLRNTSSIVKLRAQEYMPKHESLLERNSALEDKGWWNYKKRRNLINKHLNLLCCVSKPSYLRT